MDKHTPETDAYGEVPLDVTNREAVAECFQGWSKLCAKLETDRDRLAADCMTLTLRLMGEDDNTFAPETREVMSRWRPMAEALLRGKPA